MADIVGLRLLNELAHGHVFDHAPARSGLTGGLMGVSLIAMLLS